MRSEIQLFFFTGTGNTLIAANAIRKRLETQGYGVTLSEIRRDTVPAFDPESTTLGLLYPVYALAPPAIVESFIATLPRTTQGEAFILANAHTDTGRSRSRIAALLRKRGYRITGTAATFTPSSSIITEETEDPQTAEEMRNAAFKNASEFADRLAAGQATVDPESVTLKQRMVAALFKTAMPGMLLKKTMVTDTCRGCGLCAANCPMDNITMNNGKPVWGKNCTVCVRCVNLCPENAIEMMNSAGKTQYRAPGFPAAN